MGRGKKWTDLENELLAQMTRQGMTVRQIYESGKFPNRSFQALDKQLERLGVDLSRQKKFSLSGQIREAEIIDLETIVRRFVDAFNKICGVKECSKEDLNRFRVIFSAARMYFDLYFKLEEFSEVKSRLERLERLVAQLANEKKTETP